MFQNSEVCLICIICCRTGGKAEYYMGSADWMTRNLTRRVEVVTPVEDESLQKELQVGQRFKFLTIWSPLHTKSRLLSVCLASFGFHNSNLSL